MNNNNDNNNDNNNETSDKVSFIRSVIEDNSGGLSTARIMSLTWSVGVFLVWAIASLLIIYTSSGTQAPVTSLLSLPWEVVTMALGFGGFKVAQRFGEK